MALGTVPVRSNACRIMCPNKVDLPPPVHFSKCTTRFPYKTYGVRKRNLGKSSINRQIQKYVANHNKDGPKTKLKMKKFLTALSSVLYFMFYFPPYVLYCIKVDLPPPVHFSICTTRFPYLNISKKTIQFVWERYQNHRFNSLKTRTHS